MSDLRWVIIDDNGQHLWLGRSTEPLHEELARAVPTLNDRGIAAWLAILLGEYWFAHSVHVVSVRLLTCRTGSWDAAVAAFQRRRNETLAGLQQRPLEPAYPNPADPAVSRS